ncbi:MAG: hypothetical protein KDC84_13710 [Crocinitomicaceae bacterium]|nr:hypothetical protein [Crocinitomicaceae bacterium]
MPVLSDYPKYNPNDLQTYFSNEDFIQKSIQQIQKNLAQFGYEFQPRLQDNDMLDNLIEELNPIVSDFIENHGEKFMAYLYQVDLNERQLAEQEYGEDYLSNVSFKIIKREAQKIYFQFLMANKKI